MFLYHYTIGLKLRSIFQEGVIQTSPLCPVWPEKPISWLSANSHYERSALKVAMGGDGRTKVLTLDEMEMMGQGIYRFVFFKKYISTQVLPWRILKKKAKMPAKIQRKLSRRAKEIGADPNDWYGCLDPIEIGKAMYIEQQINGTWMPVDPAILNVCEDHRVLQSTASELGISIGTGQFKAGRRI